MALKEGLPKYRIELDEAGNLTSLFPGASEICLEIGFGSGEHLLALAQRHPDTGFIGCEPFMNGVSALVRAIEETGAANIRIFTEDARFLLKALPTQSITRCFVLFADPWPKKRHNKRRIVNPETLDDLARILTLNGRVLLATDDAALAKWYKETVTAHQAFTLHAVERSDTAQRLDDWPETRYERKARELLRQVSYYVVNRRCLI